MTLDEKTREEIAHVLLPALDFLPLDKVMHNWCNEYCEHGLHGDDCPRKQECSDFAKLH